ncbi:hypothetical protein [Sulfurisphaera ohwakuensis]|uniref:Uncharacterized protein n=1 Tax=Sulfurisphaera ohwakuensis TaxID=69656 RepID=A0A650CFT7_SULOH|nr:hypothetical protein [Sulfurisphaera ohwakuensis]MBB5255299.1 hypothetical protein [Sulfurisphaera ohwakuensis]QGR16606.1 hypothetical protein D1869_04910 [Sulfurisphaera ohwakuensis]
MRIKRYDKNEFLFLAVLALIPSFPLFAIVSFLTTHSISILIFPFSYLNAFLAGFYLKIDDFHAINLSVFTEIGISMFFILFFISKENLLLLLVSIIVTFALAGKLSKVTKIGVTSNIGVIFYFSLLNLFLFNSQILVQNTFISSFIGILLQDILKSRKIHPDINSLPFKVKEKLVIIGGLSGFDGLYVIPFMSTFINFLITYIFNFHNPFMLQNLIQNTFKSF